MNARCFCGQGINWNQLWVELRCCVNTCKTFFGTGTGVKTSWTCFAPGPIAAMFSLHRDFLHLFHIRRVECRRELSHERDMGIGEKKHLEVPPFLSDSYLVNRFLFKNSILRNIYFIYW